MSELHMGTAEARFADIVWENAPCASGVLVKLAAEAFEWKKTTTSFRFSSFEIRYTVSFTSSRLSIRLS